MLGTDIGHKMKTLIDLNKLTLEEKEQLSDRLSNEVWEEQKRGYVEEVKNFKGGFFKHHYSNYTTYYHIKSPKKNSFYLRGCFFNVYNDMSDEYYLAFHKLSYSFLDFQKDLQNKILLPITKQEYQNAFNKTIKLIKEF